MLLKSKQSYLPEVKYGAKCFFATAIFANVTVDSGGRIIRFSTGAKEDTQNVRIVGSDNTTIIYVFVVKRSIKTEQFALRTSMFTK